MNKGFWSRERFRSHKCFLSGRRFPSARHFLPGKRFLPGLIAGFVLIATVLVSGPARAGVMRLEIDRVRSHIKATVAAPLSRINGLVTATMNITSGEIAGDPDNLAATGHVRISIDPTSYNSGSDHRDREVLAKAFETAKYSGITFESTRIEDLQVIAPGSMATLAVVGNLRMHGTTRQIRVPVRVSMSPDGQFSADGEITLDYTDWGVKVPGVGFGLLPAGRKVTVAFSIEAAKGGTVIPMSAPSQ